MKPDDAMRRALALAARGIGLTRPNPPVGAVVVRAGRIVGGGWHRAAGRPHAEVEALRAAGARARGGDLYVTLEPCCTHGRTPPCTEAIIGAGVRRVWAAATDPNPRHRGRGFRRLRAAGIEVQAGLCGAEAQALLEPFATRMRLGRPKVTLKMACSLDGRIADAEGRSRWITGPRARAAVQTLRRTADAILIGARTASADDPSLLPRPARGRRPWRVVADPRGQLTPKARLLREQPEQTLVCVGPACPARARRAIEATGARCWTVPADPAGGLDLRVLLERLAAELGVMHVLCEGGGRMAGALLRAELADELWWFVAPCILGTDGAPAVGGPGGPLAAAPRYAVTSVDRMGGDVCVRLRPRKPRGRAGTG
jgi:diaminohydroxyphosphoribosylaminopyrimidine deaminase / 5-amino-6-(5-phosphoribosylamino)uracil reductase